MSAILELERFPAEFEPYREKIEMRIEEEAAKRGEDVRAVATFLILIFLAAAYKDQGKSEAPEVYRIIGQALDLLPPAKPFHETANAEEWVKQLNQLGEGLPPLKPLSSKALRRETIYEDVA
jgi:hypothetical protein